MTLIKCAAKFLFPFLIMPATHCWSCDLAVGDQETIVRTSERTQERRVIKCSKNAEAKCSQPQPINTELRFFYAELKKVFCAIFFIPSCLIGNTRIWRFSVSVCEQRPGRFSIEHWRQDNMPCAEPSRPQRIVRIRFCVLFFCYAKLNIQSALRNGLFLCIKHERNGLLRGFSLSLFSNLRRTRRFELLCAASMNVGNVLGVRNKGVFFPTFRFHFHHSASAITPLNA